MRALSAPATTTSAPSVRAVSSFCCALFRSCVLRAAASSGDISPGVCACLLVCVLRGCGVIGGCGDRAYSSTSAFPFGLRLPDNDGLGDCSGGRLQHFPSEYCRL